MGTEALSHRKEIAPFWKWVIAVGICEAAGIISGLIAQVDQSTWYAMLEKPAWNPPNWIFAPVWTAMYLLMGTALWLVWKNDAAQSNKKLAFSIFAIQLFLNFCWSIIFFNFHSPLWALVDILLLDTAIILTMASFWRISKPAVWIMMPYLLWVAFATVLNYQIWLLN